MSKIFKKDKISFSEWICISTVYLMGLGILVPFVNSIALWGLAPLSFAICIVKNLNILKSRYIVLLILLFLWLTVLWPIAQFYDDATNLIVRCWGTFIICVICFSMGTKRKTFIVLSAAWIFMLIEILWYAQTHLGELIAEATAGKDTRLNDHTINANAISYFLIIATSVIYIYGEILTGKLRQYSQIALFALVPLTFYMSILTASRQMIILGIPFVGILLIKRYYKANPRNVFIGVIASMVLAGAYIGYGEQIYKRSFLHKRMNKELRKDSRAALIRESLEIFAENPFTGIGPDQFRHHSGEGAGAHNSYLELLADSGILGCLFFVLIIATAVFRQFKRWRRTKSPVYFGLFCYCFTFAVENMFYIFYIAPLFFGYFYLSISYCDYRWKTIVSNYNKSTSIAMSSRLGNNQIELR